MITRKKFLMFGAIFALSPLLIMSGLNCTSKEMLQDPNVSLSDNSFDELIKKQPLFVTNPQLSKEGNLTLIVFSAIFSPNDFPVVFRLVERANKIMLQTVSIEIQERVGDMAYVSNLDYGDVLLSKPVESMNELRRSNLMELRQRFLQRKPL